MYAPFLWNQLSRRGIRQLAEACHGRSLATASRPRPIKLQHRFLHCKCAVQNRLTVRIPRNFALVEQSEKIALQTCLYNFVPRFTIRPHQGFSTSHKLFFDQHRRICNQIFLMKMMDSISTTPACLGNLSRFMPKFSALQTLVEYLSPRSIRSSTFDKVGKPPVPSVSSMPEKKY